MNHRILTRIIKDCFSKNLLYDFTITDLSTNKIILDRQNIDVRKKDEDIVSSKDLDGWILTKVIEHKLYLNISWMRGYMHEEEFIDEQYDLEDSLLQLSRIDNSKSKLLLCLNDMLKSKNINELNQLKTSFYHLMLETFDELYIHPFNDSSNSSILPLLLNIEDRNLEIDMYIKHQSANIIMLPVSLSNNDSILSEDIIKEFSRRKISSWLKLKDGKVSL